METDFLVVPNERTRERRHKLKYRKDMQRLLVPTN